MVHPIDSPCWLRLRTCLAPTPPPEVTNRLCSLLPSLRTPGRTSSLAVPKTARPTLCSRHTGLLAVPPNLHSHLPGVKYFTPGVYMVHSLLHSTLLKCHLRDVVFDHSKQFLHFSFPKQNYTLHPRQPLTLLCFLSLIVSYYIII